MSSSPDVQIHPRPEMTGIEVEARTPDEAIVQGLDELNLERGLAEITVLDRGSKGFLGLGSRPARVRISPKAQIASAVRAMAGEILRLMGIEASVSARQNGRTVLVEIESGETDGLLIGRKGETLLSLQHLLTRMAGRQTPLGEAARVEVDIAGYRGRREAQLAEMARGLAEKVERSGRRSMTEPLTAADRKVIHQALAGNDRIEAHTTGAGSSKRIVITRRRTSRERPST